MNGKLWPLSNFLLHVQNKMLTGHFVTLFQKERKNLLRYDFTVSLLA